MAKEAAVTEGRATGTLGPAQAAAEEGAAAVEMGLEVEVPAGGVGPWRTLGLKE